MHIVWEGDHNCFPLQTILLHVLFWDILWFMWNTVYLGDACVYLYMLFPFRVNCRIFYYFHQNHIIQVLILLKSLKQSRGARPHYFSMEHLHNTLSLQCNIRTYIVYNFCFCGELNVWSEFFLPKKEENCNPLNADVLAEPLKYWSAVSQFQECMRLWFESLQPQVKVYQSFRSADWLVPFPSSFVHHTKMKYARYMFCYCWWVMWCAFLWKWSRLA